MTAKITSQCVGCGQLLASGVYRCRKNCGEGITIAPPHAYGKRLRDIDARGTQSLLFTGLDCEPGQRDLFDTDGETNHV